MVHAGLNWRMSPRRSFHPVVYFASIDNEEHFPYDLGRNRADDGFVGKLGLPLELLIHEASGAPDPQSHLLSAPTGLRRRQCPDVHSRLTR